MAFEMTGEDKRRRYGRVREQLGELLPKTDDRVARMATIAALLHHKLGNYFWTGFYRVIEGQLLVGPYQGTLACLKLKENTGVCWAAVREKATQVVPDVTQFPGHIACDSRSRSEIAVPCFDGQGRVWAVLDVDSTELNAFDGVDAEELEKIVKLID